MALREKRTNKNAATYFILFKRKFGVR